MSLVAVVLWLRSFAALVVLLFCGVLVVVPVFVLTAIIAVSVFAVVDGVGACWRWCWCLRRCLTVCCYCCDWLSLLL